MAAERTDFYVLLLNTDGDGQDGEEEQISQMFSAIEQRLIDWSTDAVDEGCTDEYVAKINNARDALVHAHRQFQEISMP
jgi:hypothetical protein